MLHWDIVVGWDSTRYIRLWSAIVNVFVSLGRDVSITIQASWKLHFSPEISVRLGNTGGTNQQTSTFYYQRDVDTYSVKEIEVHDQTHHHQDFIGQCWDQPT